MPRRQDPKLVALKSVPLFAGMTRKELGAVGRIADEIELPPGKELIREDMLGKQFFILLEGEAEVRRRGRKVNRLRAMDFFGEIALLRTGKTTATVTAATSVRAVVITRPSFLKLLRDDPRVQLTVLDALVKRMPGDDVFTPS